MVLLLENGVLYARLVAAHGRERERHREVLQQSVELAAVNKELEAFSYSVSHDLRAPLRAVDGFSRLLEEGQAERLDDEGRRLLGVVRANARRMGELIEDLLAFSRLGRLPLHTRPVQLDDLVRQTVDELRLAVDGRRIDFAVGSLGGAEVDPSLLKQVLVNLLGNAVKFTRDRDPAVIEVGARDAPEAGTARVYYVRDNGAGFDMRHASKLFGVFQRLHRAEEFEGTGVGLAIAQRVIARHGGRIWAEAALGEGATFYFTLAADEPASEPE
jgi:two-component system sensor kinase